MTIHSHQIAIALVVTLAAGVGVASAGTDGDRGHGHSSAPDRPFGHAPTALPPILPRVSARSLTRAKQAEKQVHVSGDPDPHGSFNPAPT
jgi:hypothetical protein